MTAEPLRILIVDDNVDSAKMLRLLLKYEGHATRVEFDGAAAVEAAREFAPDVILMDLSLPSMSGADATIAIKAAPGTSGCVVVAVTGHGEDALPCPSPFDHYMAKPIDHDTLVGLLAGIRAKLDRGHRPRLAVA